MTALLEYQAALAAAMRGGDRARALALFAGTPDRRERGFKVYANNATHVLISALGDTFPAVRRILGETVFTSIAIAYVRAQPPARDGLLIWYGGPFPRFLDSLKMPGAPDIADLARLEFAWLEAYHAAEAAPLPVSDFAALTPGQLVAARLVLHPSVRLLRSSCAVDTLWNVVRNGSPNGAGPERGGERCLVVARPFAEVLVLPVSSPVFACLAGLRDSEPFGDASRHLDPAEAAPALQALIAAGLFTAIETGS
ncbi:MAG TPA: DNA-binding domain-containing protein [Rhodospirillales bacterium]|nr:DNA-binding domain-containing protein [Rhodospirillales bacterium]